MSHSRLPRRAAACAPLFAALAITAITMTAAPARADRGPLLPADAPAAYAQECASCHAPYPPGMLPAASWKRLMAGLDRHYGSDAALEPVTRTQIEAWLLRHAGGYKRTGSTPPPDDRITRSDWFARKHRGVEAATWRLPSVKTAANCAACHTGADRGLYDDDDLRLPAGASLRQRWSWHD